MGGGWAVASGAAPKAVVAVASVLLAPILAVLFRARGPGNVRVPLLRLGHSILCREGAAGDEIVFHSTFFWQNKFSRFAPQK